MSNVSAMMTLSRKSKLAIALVSIVVLIASLILWMSQKQEILNYKLLAAASEGNVSEASSLLKSGAQVNARFGGDGQTPLHRAAAKNQHEMVSFLLKNGADPNSSDADGNTPLIVAAYKGNVEAGLLLIAAKADVNAAEMRYGMTPLLEAARKGHLELVRRLLAAGANRDARTKDGRTARDLATANGHIEIAQALASVH